jgi:RNA polymerase-binding transcription factor
MALNTKRVCNVRLCEIGELVVNAGDLRRYKKLLLAKRDELSRARDGAESFVPRAGASEGDLIDSANADAEAELQAHMRETDARLLKAIEDALARMRAGTFGICAACKEPISRTRLEAVPWTHYCRDCKQHKSI